MYLFRPRSNLELINKEDFNESRKRILLYR